jgi:hypothetical protein
MFLRRGEAACLPHRLDPLPEKTLFEVRDFRMNLTKNVTEKGKCLLQTPA